MNLVIWLQALGLIVGMMTVLWAVSVLRRDASIVDLFWGVGFTLAAWTYFFLADGVAERKLLVVGLATVWGLRLAIYLTWRNWGKPEDFRYQGFREKYGRERYWWFSYFQVFLLQGGLAWLISIPLLAAMSGERPLGWLDAVATAVWLLGFLFETVGDWQLARFKANPANQGQLLTTGLWRYTRHPNYFGDAAVWWAFGLFSIAAGFWWPIVGSLVMTFLLVRVSGVAMLERTLSRTKPGYETYVRQTNAFIPWFPRNLTDDSSIPAPKRP